MGIFDSFTNLYPISKTLRFELIPIGRTQEHILKQGFLEMDEHRSESYKIVKQIMDEYHRELIEEVLSDLKLVKLEDYYELYCISAKTDQQEKNFQALKGELRRQIADAFKKHPRFKNLFKAELIKTDLMEYVKDDRKKQEILREFEKFTTYFTGFFENRKNLYVAEKKATAIAYRIIDQNLPKYIDNMNIFQLAKNQGLQREFERVEKELSGYIKFQDLEEYFSLDGYNKVLSQSGIRIYNGILGGYSDEKRVKIQGINEVINLFNQKIERRESKKIPKCKMLFKQILSDDEKISFIPSKFETDEETLLAIKEFCELAEMAVFTGGENSSIQELFSGLDGYDLQHIYIQNNSSITDISQHCFGDWAILTKAIEHDYDACSKAKNKATESYVEKRKKEISKIKHFSIYELNQYAGIYTGEKVKIEEYFTGQILELAERIREEHKLCAEFLDAHLPDGKSLRNNDKVIDRIKTLLDHYKNLQHVMKQLMVEDEPDKDQLFYVEFERMWESLDGVTMLYNKVRNYITQKPYSLEKFKINFERPTLLEGWDRNSEKAYLGIILRKDGMYYLGIMDRKYNKCISEAPDSPGENNYQKMNYKLLQGANKMLPKVFFAKKNYDQFQPDKDLLKRYKAGTHIKSNPNFSLDDCHALIDFFKEAILKHEDWSKFNFSFSDTKTYEDISGFYREVETQGYKVSFCDINADYIDSLVSSGKLYLFQIYNKDFSPSSKGTPNLHTLYWNMLFHPDNLKDVVYKLNGKAEIFYRRASIKKKDIIIHAANKPIPNKDPHQNTDSNNIKETSVFSYDIVKDRRYTVDKYQFHVPITMNFKAAGGSNMNLRVNQCIKSTDGWNVIGIDRGERNLLYLVLIDPDGHIIKQKSLNEIVSYDQKGAGHKKDYQYLLNEREKDNKQARTSWKTINQIKELKEGYLSQVIHLITDWMIEYQAIVVLEDLNFGFKRSRQKFEKQVYQKFEKMLIEKLNYLVDKKINPELPEGLLHAYQLTTQFDTFQNLGKQSGFLFYVPSWMTSKIDPTTGFANLFYSSDLKYSSINNTQTFFGKFKEIYFCENGINNEEYFVFAFDYSKFTYKADGTKTEWRVCTYGKRAHTYRRNDRNNQWDTEWIDLTERMKLLFEKYDIDYIGEDIKKSVCDVHNEKLDKQFYSEILFLFAMTLQMRNSDSQKGIDRMISPVVNFRNEFYDTDTSHDVWPENADANGAYNIAKKGLWIIEKIKHTDDNDLKKVKLSMSNREWLNYAQEHIL